MRHLAAISAFVLLTFSSSAEAVDIDLQTYTCRDFLADIKEPANGAKLLKSLMIISWSTGYAAAYQKKDPRGDPAALRLIAATLGVDCAKSPDRSAIQVIAQAIQKFAVTAEPRPNTPPLESLTAAANAGAQSGPAQNIRTQCKADFAIRVRDGLRQPSQLDKFMEACIERGGKSDLGLH